jgi:hypothetical protein
MSDWLDTETKAILQGAPPAKLAPPDTVGFTLVLLSKSDDHRRLQDALAKAGSRDPAALLAGECPQIVAAGVTLEEALLGQFELACCDSAAVFLRDAVVAADDRSYLSRLYSELLTGEEFEPTGIEIRSVPNDSRGRRFLNQFVGTEETWIQLIGLPLRLRVMGKKARLMWHWGTKIGAEIRIED